MPSYRKTGTRKTACGLFVLAFLAIAVKPVLAVARVPVPPHKPVVLVKDPVKTGAVPLPGRRPLSTKGLPLSADNALLYRKIFAFQAVGNWKDADALFPLLTDMRLRGHMLFQRYMHPTGYQASFEELAGWLDLYADHPGADRVYKLALARMPADFYGTLAKPRQGSGVSGYLGVIHDRERAYRSSRTRTRTQNDAVEALAAAIRADLSRGAPTRAYGRLQDDDRAALLDDVEYDRLQAQIAGSYMLTGYPDKALLLAMKSADRAGEKAPDAGWFGGLSAWRLGDYKTAARLFEQTAESDYVSSWTAAAGAYWAARAHMRAGDVRESSRCLQKAATNPRTFYGLIATRALGWDFDFNWTLPATDSGSDKGEKMLPGIARAMALVAAGQYHWAEDELRNLDYGRDGALHPFLLAYTQKVGLPAFSMRLGEAVSPPEGGLYDAALYPVAPWEPLGGYTVDRALIYALIRQESRFDPEAENKNSGATGLMQLMPQTAGYVAGDRDFRSKTGRYALKDPQTNLAIGQRYVADLLGQDAIGGDLFSLLIAYNAGPGNLRKWKRTLADIQDDPLLFIETVPMAETRAFVERVMANAWIYRLRLGQDTPSLDTVAEGGWARYVALDGRRFAESTEKPSRPRRTRKDRYSYN
ncbi:MAG: lytic transglycosylase domain-containing protein [Alphaproteobacteria bacterium]|nr:lytic transglycosylase domain-containing protein [Alphaproteobacteria bacterium]